MRMESLDEAGCQLGCPIDGNVFGVSVPHVNDKAIARGFTRVIRPVALLGKELLDLFGSHLHRALGVDGHARVQ